jgi:uncharacterized membrane protein
VTQAEPAPDDQRDGLAWYGLRTFGPGEPRVTLGKPSFPLVPVIIAVILIFLLIAGFMAYRTIRHPNLQEEPEEPSAPLTEEEEAGLEERIISLLEAGGGEQYQSAIVRALGVPRSTVSSALNSLHQRGLIQKVRKGRENLIRLVRDPQGS